ncbi:MAG: Tm-1-like ATP-binding domain-containing protein [Deltaproteobacteria bacterium]|nr:Tm-1-like ATP-binding domain-containing protein [Deltaproteobacteria bacterium]MBW2044416.1 Tm-1-like ATP-binding domain-containing protein [Deltaproteobacteria bacterium]
MQSKEIAIIATLDTRGKAAEYLRDRIRERGHNPIVVDVCTALKNPPFEPDITHQKVAEAISKSIEEIASMEEAEAISVMAEGTSSIVRELYSSGKLDGIVGLGGSMGTSLGLKVMKDLPVNIPKLMLSTITFTALVTPESVAMDQIMMQTITHSCGVDRITRMVLDRAAGAICGMAEAQGEEKAEKPVVAITTLGASVFSHADYCTQMLLDKGYDPAVFHTIGMNTYERLITQGYIAGILDFSMFELTNYVCGGVIKGAEAKLTAACEKGIPQVVAPGAISWFQWTGTIDTLPAKYKNRKVRWHNPLTAQVSVSKEEKVEIARRMAERLNKAKGPAALLIPLRSFSRLDEEGTPMYDPEGRREFIEVLRESINPDVVKLIELDMSINDPVFSEKAVMLLDEMMREGH